MNAVILKAIFFLKTIKDSLKESFRKELLNFLLRTNLFWEYEKKLEAIQAGAQVSCQRELLNELERLAVDGWELLSLGKDNKITFKRGDVISETTIFQQNGRWCVWSSNTTNPALMVATIYVLTI